MPPHSFPNTLLFFLHFHQSRREYLPLGKKIFEYDAKENVLREKMNSFFIFISSAGTIDVPRSVADDHPGSSWSTREKNQILMISFLLFVSLYLFFWNSSFTRCSMEQPLISYRQSFELWNKEFIELDLYSISKRRQKCH